MDTIYAEGQRRYVESLSSYARQFLGQLQKPKLEQISGLSPAIAIEQKTTSKSPRSTVGTITEIYDYLRILYARLGQRYCSHCNVPIGTQTTDGIIERILAMPVGTKLYILAPVERKGNEKYETVFDDIRRNGFSRIRVDGRSYSLEDPPAIDHRRKHKVEVVVDRNIVKPGTRTRLAEAVEQALELGKGVLHIAHVDAEREEPHWRSERFSRHLACDTCGRSAEPLNPHNYSFNSPLGWCPTCEGLGFQRGASLQLLLRDPALSVRAGALSAWPSLETGSPFLPFAEAIARHAGFSLDTPYRELDPSHQRILLQGTGETWLTLGDAARTPFQYKGLFQAIDEASRVSFVYRQRLGELVDEVPCATCQGSRLRADAAATRFDNLTIGDLCARPLGDTLARFDKLKLTKQDQQIVGEILREIVARLRFLVQVGLDYLNLDRPGPTLSGGEAQRIRLASQIGSGLTGVLYVLDEPTIGLHPRDNTRLLTALQQLRDLGNTLVLVEHDREVIAAADALYDFGPGAGDEGGEITASGPPAKVAKSLSSLTGQYLSGKRAIFIPTNRRILKKEEGKRKKEEGRNDENRTRGRKKKESDDPIVPQLLADYEFPTGQFLTVIGARQNNLRDVTVSFPLGSFIAVTGVSGSGKSSLIHEVLYNTLARKLHRAHTVAAAHEAIHGIEHLDKIIRVDQDPIGNSPSSNPATYTGAFDLIRELFARLPESKVRGYHPRRFSFNQKGGRCEACEGNGQKKIEMHFLPDVWVECTVCQGKRYTPETLAVQYHGHSIADILNLRITEALALFGNIPKIRVILQTLVDVGLGYMTLGQSAPTMSGGEAQRVKLAAELARPSTGRTIYLLDEPTTGLHFDDVRKLLDVLQRLVDLGNTVIVVEHNLDVIKTADWVIDLGPEAGRGGGQIVTAGTPEDVSQYAQQHLQTDRRSYTGEILTNILATEQREPRTVFDPRAVVLKQEGDLDINQVGRNAEMPWQKDGKSWHTRDRVTTQGTACKWDGTALAWIEERIHQLGTFSATNWNHRSVVEIAAPKKTHGWFLHALTGHEGYLSLVFRVKKNSFRVGELTAQLGIAPLADHAGFEHYSRQKRVEVSQGKGPWQEVVITVVQLAEIDTPAFQTFLEQAVVSFHKNLDRMQNAVEDVMPWKVNGKAWHLGPKGFPPAKPPQWELVLVQQLVNLLQTVDPDIEFKWDTRDTVSFKLPAVSRSWGRIRTKDPAALELQLYGKPGQFNLARIETFGDTPTLKRDKSEGADIMTLRFIRANRFRAAELQSLLTEHRIGFRETFGG
ncbi:MAG: hypothetical protein LC104_10770 [Bacteroidales bacterium]|nr:hypothetical protein [Bacteroidales bacterium]